MEHVFWDFGCKIATGECSHFTLPILVLYLSNSELQECVQNKVLSKDVLDEFKVGTCVLKSRYFKCFLLPF